MTLFMSPFSPVVSAPFLISSSFFSFGRNDGNSEGIFIRERNLFCLCKGHFSIDAPFPLTFLTPFCLEYCNLGEPLRILLDLLRRQIHDGSGLNARLKLHCLFLKCRPHLACLLRTRCCGRRKREERWI